MAYGGGNFTAQNKVLPGAYINFNSVATTTSIFGTRGTVGILGNFEGDEYVYEWTYDDFKENCEEVIGLPWDTEYDVENPTQTQLIRSLREIFCHATKVVISRVLPSASSNPITIETGLENISKKPFNILICDREDEKETYDEFTKDQRDNYGVKFQTIYFNYPGANHESAISLFGKNNKQLIYWTAGALAGASFAESLCNKTYDGELELSELKADMAPADLENAIATGSFAFHTVGDTVRVLDDINTYVDAGENKEKDPEIFNDNQSIRVIDQIGNDIATIFVNNYLGKVPSDDSGRSSFWNALVDYHNQMQELGGIQNFKSSDITVSAGTQRNSVVVNEVITIGSSMKKLYMTVTVK